MPTKITILDLPTELLLHILRYTVELTNSPHQRSLTVPTVGRKSCFKQKGNNTKYVARTVDIYPSALDFGSCIWMAHCAPPFGLRLADLIKANDPIVMSSATQLTSLIIVSKNACVSAFCSKMKFLILDTQAMGIHRSVGEIWRFLDILLTTDRQNCLAFPSLERISILQPRKLERNAWRSIAMLRKGGKDVGKIIVIPREPTSESKRQAKGSSVVWRREIEKQIWECQVKKTGGFKGLLSRLHLHCLSRTKS